MSEGSPTPEEAIVLKLLRTAAAKRAEKLGVSPIDYLIGVLDGRYPRFTQEELADAGRVESGKLSARDN